MDNLATKLKTIPHYEPNLFIFGNDLLFLLSISPQSNDGGELRPLNKVSFSQSSCFSCVRYITKLFTATLHTSFSP